MTRQNSPAQGREAARQAGERITDAIPPYNLEAESALLGCLLIEPERLEQATAWIGPEDFYRDAHRYIFEAILHLVETGSAVDLITVPACLSDRGQLEACGGLAYLLNLMEAPSSVVNLPHYAGIVAEKSTRRRLIAAATQTYYRAKDEEIAIEQALAEAEQAILTAGLRQRADTMTEISPLLSDRVTAFNDRQKAGKRITGVETGLDDLDWVTQGLQPGELTILAARPSMGKSALAVQIAQHVVLEIGQAGIIFSLEMTKESVVDRILCSQARIDSHLWRNGMVRAEDIPRVNAAIQALWGQPLYLDDSRNITLAEMRAKCRRVRAQKGSIGIVVVDYLQIMTPPRPSGNRAQELSELAAGIKGLAREFACPVIALSQLSRAVEHRGDKKPTMADLRESGGLEAEADVICLLYREAYYRRGEADFDPCAWGKAEINIAKNRNGVTAVVELGFHPTYGRFETLADGVVEPDPFAEDAAIAADPEQNGDFTPDLDFLAENL
jgi:replicative DNA helicase